MFRSANLTVMVADFDRAVRFYTEAVGLPLKVRHGDAWAEIEAPGLTIGLHPTWPGGPKAGAETHMSVGLAVDNLPAAMAELQARGVVFSGAEQGEGAEFAHFTDPDGTPLYLAKIAH